MANRELIGSKEDEAVADFPGTKFHSFISRPDIKAPRFKVEIYDEDALADGYWFVAPYHNLDQGSNAKKWVGPYIYDTFGELVWSGAGLFNHFNTYDFKKSIVDGEEMLNVKYPHGNVGSIFDSSYRVRREVIMNNDTTARDMHEFNLLDDGSRVLTVTSTEGRSTEEQARAIGVNGTCSSQWKGIQELDTLTSKPVFEWDARDHLGLDETTYMPGDYQSMCSNSWDILHLNAVDKFADGDYLVSSRHTDTLYKINHRDGSVVWRLGGKESEFSFDTDGVKFSRQHHATVRGQNETHTMVAMFDNAIGTGSKNEKPSHKNSRGLLLALQHDTMTASIAAEYDHPHGGMTNSRGSFQTLPNGNAFMGWTYHTLLSEHAPDGRLVMEASLKLPGHCYRSYKFPWVGHPAQAPDVYSSAVESKDQEKVRTVVYVSWNGATEVVTWRLHKSDETGNVTEVVASVPRQGFETSLVYDGYASHVVAEALDRHGKPLGRSPAVQTIPPSNMLSEPVLEDAKWLQGHTISRFTALMASFTDNSVVVFLSGMTAAALAGLVGWAGWRSRQKAMRFLRLDKEAAYEPLYQDHDQELERDGNKIPEVRLNGEEI